MACLYGLSKVLLFFLGEVSLFEIIYYNIALVIYVYILKNCVKNIFHK